MSVRKPRLCILHPARRSVPRTGRSIQQGLVSRSLVRRPEIVTAALFFGGWTGVDRWINAAAIKESPLTAFTVGTRWGSAARHSLLSVADPLALGRPLRRCMHRHPLRPVLLRTVLAVRAHLLRQPQVCHSSCIRERSILRKTVIRSIAGTTQSRGSASRTRTSLLGLRQGAKRRRLEHTNTCGLARGIAPRLCRYLRRRFGFDL